nr:TonB-dependent receptor [Neolewinella litorea]
MLFLSLGLLGQGAELSGIVIGVDGSPLEGVSVRLADSDRGTWTEADGSFRFTGLSGGELSLRFSRIGYHPLDQSFSVAASNPTVTIVLEPRDAFLDEVVVSGTLKEVSRSSSPVPIEVYTARYFAANPAPNFFESLQQVNGVRPQLNCNVCNTGDIHINGLEGPYTMVLLDGMPIVSGLSTVYGLTGIPQGLIERMEVVKGPASTLYGSEAVGGLINIITRDPGSGPELVADAMVTSWGETNLDLGLNRRVGRGSRTLLGLNYFRYADPRDNNGDNFTDVTLQDRISVFNKWSFDRVEDRVFTLAARYLYEDRWGGELEYGPAYRGGNEVYGESIYTNRWESIGNYQLPVAGEAFFQFSLNGHYHDSAYGNTVYLGKQYIGFGQFTYRPVIDGNHDLLFGTAYRYTWYDDNTTATGAETGNAPAITSLPGAFVQDEIHLNRRNTLLLGLRFDHNNRHGAIFTPRLNYKWNDDDQSNVIRVSIGNGYRVANVFTEDHAALTGAREVIFAEELRPETSWNANLNYVRRIYDWSWGIVGFDGSLWYTRFGNRILPDYESNPNQIIYANLDGHAVSRGGSLNVDVNLTTGMLANLGVTIQEVYVNEGGERQRQLLTEGASAVWKITQPLSRGWTVDYTGNLYGPMRLPLLGELDNRPATSPWFSLQNLQVTKKWGESVEVYGGVKNLLNYTPPGNSIARPFDPFDRDVTFNSDGEVIATPGNPHALTFDPTYVFAPNQGIRLFAGVRYGLE